MAIDSVATHTQHRPRRRRGTLNTDDILDGAFTLAAKTSLDSLTMPLLAAQLKVGVTSIYWYFRRKEDLLDAMTDRALEQYSAAITPVTTQGWDRSLREHARSMRRLLRDDPVLCDLVVMRTATYGPTSSQVMLERFESVLSTLIEVGFRPEDALSIYLSISMHARGLAMQERRQDIDREVGIARAEITDREKVPTVLTLIKQGHTIGADEDTFEYGLDCYIERAQDVLRKTGQPKVARGPRKKGTPTPTPPIAP